MTRHRWSLAALPLALVLTLVIPGRAAAAKTAADVSLALSGPSTASVGEPFALQVATSNAGPALATGVTATVRIPVGLTAQSGGSCTTDGAGTVCTFGPTSLPAGLGIATLVQLVATTAGSYVITGTVVAVEPDPDPADNSATTTVVVGQGTADVSIGLSAPRSAFVGQGFGVQVGISNAGPAPATGVTWALRVPAGLTVQSGGSCTPDGAGTVCTFGPTSLPAGLGVATMVALVATAAGSYSVTGSVSADEPDPDPTDNTASTAITVASSADVSVDVSGPATSAPNRTVAYTVTVTNAGPSPAANVTLTDAWTTSVTGGVRLLSASTTQGMCAAIGGAVTCDLGDLAAGGTATVTVVLRPHGVGSITDEAHVTAADDPDPANNVDRTTTVVG